ncbi:hypothetical protein PG987_009519 [Apiospora arundinis]
MRTSLLFIALPILSSAADLPCDVESDNCRAVINGSACFNKYLAGGGNTRLVLSCLAGTEGSATPQQKKQCLSIMNNSL